MPCGCRKSSVPRHTPEQLEAIRERQEARIAAYEEKKRIRLQARENRRTVGRR